MSRHSFQSTQGATGAMSATPSIARRSSQHLFQHNKVGLSQLVVKIEWGVAHLEKVKGNAVKMPSAELNLAEYFDSARVWMDELLQKKDKRQLRACFEGRNMQLLAHLEALCERVELKVSSDKRRLDLMERCRTVEEVLADLGYADELRKAKIAEKQGFLPEGEEEELSTAGQVVPHLAEAAFFGAQAIAQEQVGDFEGAAETYDKATKSIRSAIAVCRAVIKFKAAIGVQSALEKDVEELQRLDDQTNMRIEHLKNLEPGAQPVPVEEHIQPVELSMHNNFWTQQQMTRAFVDHSGRAVATGTAVTGLVIMGPFGLVLMAGAAIGSMIAASQGRHEDYPTVLNTLADMGDMAAEVAGATRQRASSLVEVAKQRVSEAQRSVEQVLSQRRPSATPEAAAAA